MTKIAVFGAGTWGIALARLLAVNGRDVTVWSAIPAELKSLSTTRRHPTCSKGSTSVWTTTATP